MKTQLIFGAKFQGHDIATVFANSYTQAGQLLGAAKIAYDELEDFGPTLAPRIAGFELAPDLCSLHLRIESPRQVGGVNFARTVELALTHGVTGGIKQRDLVLHLAFVASISVQSEVIETFKRLKNKIAFDLDTAHRLPGGYLTERAGGVNAAPTRKKVSSPKWEQTDASCNQYGRQLTQGVYEFKEGSGRNKYRQTITLAEWPTELVESIVSAYYDSVSALRAGNGILIDGPDADWLIAECIFEQHMDPPRV